MRRRSRPEKFLELLEPLRHSLYRHARRTAWREDLAADIVQEAVMTAWREFDRFVPGTNFQAWMFRILINTAYRLNKRLGRRREVALDEEAADLGAVLEREETWASLLEDRDRLMQLLDDRLVHALESLGADERECLLLRLLEGFSYKEIAAMLDVPLGTVMSHVHRGRIKLRERLAGLAGELGYSGASVR